MFNEVTRLKCVSKRFFKKDVTMLKTFFWTFIQQKYHYFRNIYKNVLKYKKATIDKCSIKIDRH